MFTPCILINAYKQPEERESTKTMRNYYKEKTQLYLTTTIKKKPVFSFRSFRKYRRAHVYFLLPPTTTLLCWLSKNPLQFIFYHLHSTNREEKIKGL